MLRTRAILLDHVDSISLSPAKLRNFATVSTTSCNVFERVVLSSDVFFGDRKRTLPSFDLYLQVRQGLSSHVTTVELLNLLEANSRLEALALPCLGYLGVQLVNGFKREAFGFVDHRPDEGETNDAESSPDEEYSSVEIGWCVDHVWRDDGNDGLKFQTRLSAKYKMKK